MIASALIDYDTWCMITIGPREAHYGDVRGIHYHRL